MLNAGELRKALDGVSDDTPVCIVSDLWMVGAEKATLISPEELAAEKLLRTTMTTEGRPLLLIE